MMKTLSAVGVVVGIPGAWPVLDWLFMQAAVRSRWALGVPERHRRGNVVSAASSQS
jgi:hypothetical protein